MVKLVVGLGNPGPAYAGTRHNVGARCVTALALRHGLILTPGRGRADLARGVIAGVTVILACPTAFMNVSGETVAALVGYYRVAIDDLLIVCDDLDRPFGALRLRSAGSAGGHNGLRSIFAHLQRMDVARLKIGIGRPPAGVTPERHVLQPFGPAEWPLLPTVIATAADAVETWIHDGMDAAMNRFNGWAPSA